MIFLLYLLLEALLTSLHQAHHLQANLHVLMARLTLIPGHPPGS